MDSEEIILKNLLKKEPQYVRELARNTRLNPNTILNIIKKTNEKDLTSVYIDDTKKKMIRFSDSLKSKNYKIRLIINDIIESGLIDFLTEKYELPTIVLFGSASKGELNENSDIDICIISDIKRNPDFATFEDFLGREIQYFNFTKDEFKKLDRELMLNIINGIVLTGFLEVF